MKWSETAGCYVEEQDSDVLTAGEIAELGPLLGDRIAALTAAIGLPPCGGCDRRRDWLNRAHEWLRSL